jgi:CBS domain-containing protein
MFAIYGTSGQMFRGPLEELRKVAPTLRVGRARAVSALVSPGMDVEVPAAQVLPELAGSAVNTPQRQAINEYASIQSPKPQRHPLTRVQDVMSPSVLTVLDTASVLDAWQTLADQGLGQAPVVNAQGGLVGLITRGELLAPEHLPGPDTHVLAWRAMLMQPVTSLMVTPMPSVEPQTDLRRVAQLLLDLGLPGLPVVADDGVVSAFISRSDILRAVVHDPPLDLWS